MKWTIALSIALLAPPVGAQSPSVPVEAAGVGARTGQVARVVIDFAELRAGPGQAYVSRGRVYQGDKVEIQRGADTGGWVEVRAAGDVRGWLRQRDIRIVPGEVVERPPPGGDGFKYDEKGRRITADGKLVGSGEGARRSVTPEDFDMDAFESGATTVETPGGESAMALDVRLGLGVSQLRRAFLSNAGPDSLLADLSSKPMGYGVDLEVVYGPIEYLAVRALFRDVRFTETRLQTAVYNDGNPFGLSVDAQQAELDAIGRFPILDGWVGAYAGGAFWRQAYREIQPTPLFITTTYIGLAAGGAAGWAFGPVDLTARGGVLMPFSVGQTPAASGEPSAFGFSGSAEVAWSFLDAWAVVGHWHFSRITTDFSGPATHIDTTITEPGNATYTQAQSIDTTHGGGVGVRWRL